MKLNHIFLLLLFQLIGIQSVFTQQLISDKNPLWHVNTQLIKLGGDSVFNNFTYRKVFLAKDTNLAFEYVGMIREDLTQSKVYMIVKSDTEDKLLYDFEVTVGEQITVFPLNFYGGGGGDPYQVEVKSIDQIIIDGQSRKRIKVDQSLSMNEQWIEGVGSTYGLVYAGLELHFDVPYPHLLCFDENEVKVFSTSDKCYATGTTGIEDKRLGNKIIYPNPTNGVLTIQDASFLSHIEIYNALNTKVATFKIETSTLDLNHLSNGIYWVKLISKDSSVVISKVVVSH